ncbi:hypothetical protein ACF1E9_13165 [Streptomyces roseolus]|uniref:hypothetical protein n=1 Tax=Streptomyces TaxID=1883 RepID=UPI0036EA2BC7
MTEALLPPPAPALTRAARVAVGGERHAGRAVPVRALTVPRVAGRHPAAVTGASGTLLRHVTMEGVLEEAAEPATV